MPDIEIVKLKLRRGTDEQRQAITLEQGELGYTTDAKRVWVGDGFTVGGNTVGNIGHITTGTRTDLPYAVVGDIVYEDNFLYQLSASYVADLSSWQFIGTKTDDLTIEYNGSNQLHIVDNSVGIAQLSSNVVRENGGLLYTSTGLSANVDESTITVDTTTGQLSVIGGTISTSSIGLGLSGGGADCIGVYTTDSFTYDGLQLEFRNAPESTVCACAFNTGTIGNGLEVAGGQLKLETIGGATINPFNTAEYDSTGRVISTETTISLNLSGCTTSSPYFGSLYRDGGETCISVLSANACGTQVSETIKSAGFIKIASGTCGNFAVPVFKLPY